MSILTTSYQSRWGYHPCSRELFFKLKQLHKWYWQTMYDFHRWHRWTRKEAQNRHGAEPAFCPAFVTDKLWFKPVTAHGEKGVKVYPKTVDDWDVLALFECARRPQSEPVLAFDAETRAKLESLHEKAVAFFE